MYSRCQGSALSLAIFFKDFKVIFKTSFGVDWSLVIATLIGFACQTFVVHWQSNAV